MYVIYECKLFVVIQKEIQTVTHLKANGGTRKKLVWSLGGCFRSACLCAYFVSLLLLFFSIKTSFTAKIKNKNFTYFFYQESERANKKARKNICVCVFEHAKRTSHFCRICASFELW